MDCGSWESRLARGSLFSLAFRWAGWQYSFSSKSSNPSEGVSLHRPVAAAVAVIVPLLAVGLTPMATASAAAPYKGANTAAVQDDFNGDGYRDLAVGAPAAANGKVTLAGEVHVFYGSASSVSPKHQTVISQATAGIPGTPERGDFFGYAVASADLDRDGYADLLVGAPYEGVSGQVDRGSVTVVWGGPNGLSGGAALPSTAGFGAGQTQCQWGMSMATGDMNGDGAPEVSTASRCGGDSYTGPFTRTGQPVSSFHEPGVGSLRSVAMGDVNGDGAAERYWFPGPTDGDLRGPVWFDSGLRASGVTRTYPEKLPYADGKIGQIGDVNGDGYGDLVTGIPDDDSILQESGGAHRGGEIQVLYGGAQGITADQKPQVVHQDTPGVPGSGEDGDMFGSSLSVGDVNGDGRADVLVGVPGESVGKVLAAGMTELLRGSASGLTTTGATSYTQDTAGVPGASEYDDTFGESVHLADLTKDGKAELFVGVPDENEDGCMWTARGSASGPVLNGSVIFGRLSSGATSREAGSLFGQALTSAQAAG